MLAWVYAAVQAFTVMVRERQVENLTDWVEVLRHSEQRELRGFAEGLLEDYAAVRVGLTLPGSNGPTEGQINRLKMVKRAIYGRGKVDLLRRRVVWRGNGVTTNTGEPLAFLHLQYAWDDLVTAPDAFLDSVSAGPHRRLL